MYVYIFVSTCGLYIITSHNMNSRYNVVMIAIIFRLICLPVCASFVLKNMITIININFGCSLHMHASDKVAK